jgi:hypothetical protein
MNCYWWWFRYFPVAKEIKKIPFFEQVELQYPQHLVESPTDSGFKFDIMKAAGTHKGQPIAVF